jgi:hypothetical protein
MYYAVMTFKEDSEPYYLGQVELEDREGGVYRETGASFQPDRVGGGGTIVPAWGYGKDARVPFPATVDTDDLWEVAPMACWCAGRYTPHSEILDDVPDQVFVYEVDASEEAKTTVKEADGVTDTRSVPDDVDINSLEHRLEWDEETAPEDLVPAGEPARMEAEYVVGFRNKQTMPLQHRHLGVSSASNPALALRDALNRLGFVPTWLPFTYPVEDVRSFEASRVINVAHPLVDES